MSWATWSTLLENWPRWLVTAQALAGKIEDLVRLTITSATATSTSGGGGSIANHRWGRTRIDLIAGNQSMIVARNADEARNTVLDICRAVGAKIVTKGYHLFALPASGNRIRVAADWAVNLVSQPIAAQLGLVSPTAARLSMEHRDAETTA